MTRPFFDNAQFKADVLAKIKLGRIGTVEDLMGAVVFLASDASALMTGTSSLSMADGPPSDFSYLIGPYAAVYAAFSRIEVP